MRMRQCLNQSSSKASVWRVDVRLGRTLHVQRCCARRVVPVQCQASKAKTARARKAPVSRKGFGASKATQQQEPWEQDLIPSYRVYYKPGFKPSRYNGPIDLKKFEDGSVGVVASEDTSCAELLVVSHPLAFLEGSMGTPPAVEDLHVSLLETELSPAVTKVLSYLPRRPLPASAAAANTATQQAAVSNTNALIEPLQSTAEIPPAEAAANSIGTSQKAQAIAANEQEMPPSFAHLLPLFWDKVGQFGFDKLSSKQLMRMLQLSCWSEEVQDPAASQVRHERPTGFIGIWPEFAFLRHSCTPNTSTVVVDRYMLVHATDDISTGQELTANKLGGVIAAPLAARQAAHQEMFGRPCSCNRCLLEQRVPEELEQQLQSVHDRAQAEWPSRLQAALEGAEVAGPEATAELLNDLQAEVSEELNMLDDALTECLPELDDRRIVLCAVYPAYDLAWQMEELLQETPDLTKLANCVALLRLFARGSEGHVYTSMVLDELYSARAQALSEEAQKMKRKTLARQRQLTLQIQKLVAGAQAAAYASAEAVTCRYGMLPEEGLVPQLQQGLAMFYTGLSALSAAKGEGQNEVPELTRNLTIEGIPVTVVDTVEGSAFAGDEGLEVGRTGAAGQRMKVDWLEAAQEDAVQDEGDDEVVPEAAALEAAAERALAAAVADLEADSAAQLAASSS